MTKLISKEQFQERFDSKHESLIAQRTQRVEEEISSILKGVALKDLSDEQQYTILKSAKYIAENKNYSEDYKLKILENIKNSAEENNYGEKINQNEGLNIFSDISDDIVYQRMIEKGDSENIKLFLERKLDVDMYFSYLNDEELIRIGNEDTFLLKKQLEEESLDNSTSVTEEGNTEKKEECEEEKKEVEVEEKVEENVENKIEKGAFIQSLIRDKIAELSYHGLQIDVKELKTRSIIDVLKGKIHRLSGIGPQGGGLDDIDNFAEIEIRNDSGLKDGDIVPVNFYVYGNDGFACTINVKIVSSSKRGVSQEKTENSGEIAEIIVPNDIVENYNGNVSIGTNGEILQLCLSESVIDEIQKIKRDVENIFNNDKILINDFINSFINLRKIGYKSLFENLRMGMSINEYKKDQGWNVLFEHLKEMQEKYEGLKKIMQQLGKIISDFVEQGKLNINEIKKILLKN